METPATSESASPSEAATGAEEQAPVILRGTSVAGGFALGEARRSDQALGTSATRRVPQDQVPAELARLQRALSLGTYFLAAFRIVFAPLDPAVRQAMVAKITSAVGVPADDYAYAMAARCTRLNAHYCGADGATGPADENANGPVTRAYQQQQQQQQRNDHRARHLQVPRT